MNHNATQQQQGLVAFHGNREEKQRLLTQLWNHHDADEIIQGRCWQDGKGGAIGCTIHSYRHRDYESLLGIPEWVAYFEDLLFDNMPDAYAKTFPIRLIDAIPVGFAGWNHVYHQMCAYILTEICTNTDHPEVRDAIRNIVAMHRREESDPDKWDQAVRDANEAYSKMDPKEEDLEHNAAKRALAVAEYSAERGMHWMAQWALDITWTPIGEIPRDVQNKIAKSTAVKMIELLEAEKQAMLGGSCSCNNNNGCNNNNNNNSSSSSTSGGGVEKQDNKTDNRR